ncbi:MAG: molybdopterin-dependent oxidoreductase [Cellvibrionaceae bacterium]
MTYVVTQACIGNKHTSCVDVCPVEAFREGPEMLFIDPKACIDCNACITECPEQAIFPENAVPADQQDFIALNAKNALIYPVIQESIDPNGTSKQKKKSDLAGRFAVVGSGPSGFYTAEALLKQMPSATVDIFERLPTPFGLVRYGVAPDHPRIKSVSANFEHIADSPQVRFFGNVHIGKDITREDLLNHYHSVIYATGGSQSRELNIPGADHDNIFGSSTFVGWYNGHPDQQNLSVSFSGTTAAVIGIGNVALDIARILILPTEELEKTDIADQALLNLKNSNINDVYLFARRGPVQAAFTPKELEQLMAIPNLDLIVDPKELELDSASLAQLEKIESNEARQNIALLQEISQRKISGGNSANNTKRIHFMFCSSPTAINQSNNAKSLTVARTELNNDASGRLTATTTDNTYEVQADLIVHAIGYQGETINELPFDNRRGVISNQQGRVALSNKSEPVKEYVAGWIKRGASGVIGSNKQCAGDTTNQILNDIPTTLTSIDRDITALLKDRTVEYVSFDDWRLLDAHELNEGKAKGRTRQKITNISEMLNVIRAAKKQVKENEKHLKELPIKTHFRSCTLCEAMCGVKIEYQGNKIISIAGDENDHHSEGHICPKGYALQDLHNDPDRLKTPLEKVDGEWLPIDWDTAYKKVAKRLVEIQDQYGKDSVGIYSGNPGSHNLGLIMGAGGLRKSLNSRNMFTAASLDQMPHQLVSYLMFGHGNLFTIPDIDHTDYMLMLGANPAASNGSLMTAGDVLKRLKGIRDRGGKIILIDPRRNESARYMSEHHFIRPASDPLFLIGIIQHIVKNKLYKPDRLRALSDDFEGLLNVFENLSNQLSIDEISLGCGISEKEIARIAEEFAAAERAVCYGRMGVSAQSYGALNHWLIVTLNLLTGNLDRQGGTMFTTPAFNKAISRPMGSFNTYQSRVRGLPEFDHQLPAAVIAEEILTPGEGQIKAFVCLAGNPVLSTPNGRAMDQGLEQLDFMVSVDFYLNETSRHADIILPPTGPFEHEQYDIVFNLLAVRNVAKFSEPLFEATENTRSDWDIVQGITQEILELRDSAKAEKMKASNSSAEQILDYGLRTGPYGEGFTEFRKDETIKHEEGMTLDVLKQYPHGIDLGPLQSNFPAYLYTEDKKIHVMPELLVNDLQRLMGETQTRKNANSLMLISRRDLRTNNSWMHNSQRLVKGKGRCALFVNPQDATRLGLSDKGNAIISSRVGELQVEVKVTDDVMPGVVCLPHGWGHHREGMRLSVAESNPGVSINDIIDDQAVDNMSGNAVLNGIPVEVRLA